MIIAEEVSTALREGRGVVALESTIISHGLPHDSSARVARQIEAAVRDSGAIPATIAIVEGHVRIGLDDDALDRIATDGNVIKSSIRDLGSVLASGALGATTVASTAYLAHRGGIRVFATGGLGGVHRGADKSFDESADLPALARTPVALVCAGVKSILDVHATLNEGGLKVGGERSDYRRGILRQPDNVRGQLLRHRAAAVRVYDQKTVSDLAAMQGAG